MNPQIEQLRKQFDGYNNAQKKDFIDKLKAKLQGNTNPEYARFLNECVTKYNTMMQTGNLSRNALDDLLDKKNNMNEQNYILAEPAQRLIAHIIDSTLITFILLFTLTLISVGAYLINMYYPSLGGGGFLIVARDIITIVPSIIFLLVSIRFWINGQSLGKKIMKIKVITKDTGDIPSLGYMFLRQTIGKVVISGMIFQLGYIWILLDKDKQAWHDKLVSSIVIKDE